MILASAADDVALRLPSRLDRPDVVVVTPRDLSRPGWRYRPGTAASTVVADGEVLRSEDLAGVVTRLPWINEAELAHIVPEDRAYVAAEMGAFVTAWLTDVTCRVANRPGPACLFGPFWRQERWALEAARLDIDVEMSSRVVATGVPDSPKPTRDTREAVTVTVVGRSWIGDVDRSLGALALALAGATGVETLTVDFICDGSTPRLVAASPWPRLEDDAVATALLDRLAEPLMSSSTEP